MALANAKSQPLLGAQFLFTPHLVASARSNGIGSTTSRESFAPTRPRSFPFDSALYSSPLTPGHAQFYPTCISGICYTRRSMSRS
jgi:hypothetical protein